jgi:hypothetical protein
MALTKTEQMDMLYSSKANTGFIVPTALTVHASPAFVLLHLPLALCAIDHE